MRRPALVLLIASSLAHAGALPAASEVKAALEAGTLAPLFATKVDIGGLLFDDPSCEAKFGAPRVITGVDRSALATCLTKQGFVVSSVQHVPDKISIVASLGEWTEAVEIVSDGGRISALLPSDSDATDRELPTFLNLPPLAGFKPTATTRDASVKTAAKYARVMLKICADSAGKVTSRRIVQASEVPALDAEVVKYAASVALLPVRSATPQCQVGGVLVPNLVQDPRTENAPPPPPPPPTLETVPPTLLEPNRTAGTKSIVPDDSDKAAMHSKGPSKLVGAVKLCLDVSGALTTVLVMKNSGFPSYDAKLHDTIANTWKYKPYMKNGAATAVCTVITFIYSQHS